MEEGEEKEERRNLPVVGGLFARGGRMAGVEAGDHSWLAPGLLIYYDDYYYYFAGDAFRQGRWEGALS